MFLAPLIRWTYGQWELLSIGSNSPVLFQPSFTIIVLNVENYKDRAGKNLMTAPWRIKALSSACWSCLWCHCCFFCTGENSGQGSTVFDCHWAPQELNTGTSGLRIFWCLSCRAPKAEHWQVQLAQLPACSHTQNVKIIDIFFKNTGKS